MVYKKESAYIKKRSKIRDHHLLDASITKGDHFTLEQDWFSEEISINEEC